MSLRRNVQPILVQSCAVTCCHDGCRTQQLDLRPGRLFDPQFGIVAVRSVQVPALLRVDPGSSGSSYLVNKLEGTHRDVGGSGDRMPPAASPLPAAAIETIRRWIDEGAPDN